jgi:hypothetical protein
MISSYRLGDLVLLGLTDEEKMLILREHPNSIAADYIKIVNGGTYLDILCEIVKKWINIYINYIPSDIRQSTIIHLRLGDVIAGNNSHEIIKRPLSLEYYKQVITSEDFPIYVMGKCFFASTSSTNYDECIVKSNKYLLEIKQHFNAFHLDNENADYTLCCGVLCKKFIQGRGYYSKLIVEIRKKMGIYNNVETDITL